MGWPYHFLDLTDAQKRERRTLLDEYASIAQVSVFVPLLVILVWQSISRLSRRWQNQADLEAPNSPYLKEGRLGHWTGPTGWKVRWRKFTWWYGGNFQLAGTHFGRRGEVMFMALWSFWLLRLCFVQTGEDYLHMTKRIGIVASSQLPLQYLLALKSPYSPLQILTRTSHETLNLYHQLLGRVVTLLLYLHAILYVNFYVQSGLLAAKIREFYVLCGIVGIIAFTAVGTTALAPVRKWSYKVFYITHVSLATALLPVLFFHVSHIRIYLYETAALYALNVVLRGWNSKTYAGSVKRIPGTNLVEIVITHPSKEFLNQWQPGQHAYLSLPGHPLSRTFRSNPFSVASIPSVDSHLRFVARMLDGNTAKLAARAYSTHEARQQLTVEGPYGIPTHAEKLLQYDRVLFVAGGVGGTFVVPLYRQRLADLSPSKGSYRRQKVSFVWVARSMGDVAWALPEGSKDREGFVERLEVHLSGRSGQSNDVVNGHLDQREYGMELEERKNLLFDEDDGSMQAVSSSPKTTGGRPNLKQVVDETFSHSSTEKVAVVVCGPPGLSQSLRQEVGQWVSRGRHVWFWDESFAL